MPEFVPRAMFPQRFDRLKSKDRALYDMVRSYLETAEWCGLEDCGPEGDSRGSEHSDRARMDRCAHPRWSMRATYRAVDDCAAFLNETACSGEDFGASTTIRELIEQHGGDFAQAGGDFYLTRNHHGAGFWDGDWPDQVGRILTAHCHVYGETYHSFHRGTIIGE